MADTKRVQGGPVEIEANLEPDWQHARKLQAIGRLTVGVAHDFNNLLSVILAYSHALAENLGPNTSLAEGLTQIRLASERAASLTRQLLMFSRPQETSSSVFDLAEAVERIRPLLARLAGEDVALRVVCGDTPGRIRLDPTQFDQVIINLVANSRDAMPSGGTITVEIAAANVVHPAPGQPVPPGDWIMMSVADTGSGIDEATRARMFEPFFTTKHQDRGTGLGLATVHGIVGACGGHVTVESEVSRGTVVRVYFPKTIEPASSATRELAGEIMPAGFETVLLVEDDPRLRIALRRLLRSRGYRVFGAASSQHALRTADKHADGIHVLITDVVLPGMNGYMLAERLRAQRPDMKVIFMSGYPGKVDGHGLTFPGVAWLQKPFTLSTIEQTMRRLLDEGFQPLPS